MQGLVGFRRFIDLPQRLCKCSNVVNSPLSPHWYFKVDEHTRCDCGSEFIGSCGEYFFCNATRYLCFKVYGTNSKHVVWRESGHSLCALDLILTARRQCIIDELRYLYDKLRIVECHLGKDCIRHIILNLNIYDG